MAYHCQFCVSGKSFLPRTVRHRGTTSYWIFCAFYCNGFNVRDDGFGIFKGLDQNPGFLKVFFTIILVQAVIVNAALVPFPVFTWIGNMFSCVPFGIQGWIAVVLLAVTMIPVDLLRKLAIGKEGRQ